MVLEPDTKRCVNEEAEPRRGWARGSVPTRSLSPEGGGHEAVCQQGCWALKRGGLGGSTSIGEEN